MEPNKKSSTEGFIIVRYNHFYTISMFVSAFCFFIVFLFTENESILKYIFLLLPLITAANGIYALSGRKYFSYELQGKRLNFYSFFGIRDRIVRYDKLFLKGKDLYREINGKTRYINITRYWCNKVDLKIFLNEIYTGLHNFEKADGPE